MTVMTVGLLSIAVYAVLLVVWLRMDRNREQYLDVKREDRA
jgi:hypothetical protein